MKTKKRTFTMTALSLLLCFCMVFGLAGCGMSQDEVDTTVTNAIATVSEQITAINGSIDELKVADTELNGYIDALETAVASLETNLAATNAKITELEESLDGAEYATVTQLTETKTSLEGQIATANTAIDTLKAADTTQNSKISALETAKASLESEITAIENRLTIVENSASSGGSCLCDTSLYATKTQLNEAKTALEGQLATVNTAIAALQTANGEIDTAITALETSVGTLEDELTTTKTTIATVKAELEDAIEAVETTVLAQLNTLKTATESDIATLKTDVAALKAKDTELANKITALETTVATLASKDWANATFATLEQYTSVQTEISGIKTNIESVNASITALETKLNSKIATDITAAINALRTELSADYVARITAATNNITTAYTGAIATAKTEITNAYTAAISSAIATSEASMKTWVNTTLADGYYTIAQIDAKIAALNTNGNAYDDTDIKADIAALETALTNAKAELTTAYNAAITTAINANNGEIDTEIANAIDTAKSELNASITAIELRVATLELKVEQNSDKIAELEAEIEELKKQINCLKGNHVAGTYSKTETTHTYTCTVCGTEVTEEHEYIEGACVCGAEIEESNVTDMKNTLYKGNTYTLQNNLTLSENASVAATDKTPILNLNGKTIYTNNYSFKWLGGDLTINGNGAFVGNYANNGVLDVQGADVTLRLVGNIAITNAAENGYHIVWNKSTLDLSDYTGAALTIYNIGLDAQPTSKIVLPDGWNLYHADGTAFAENETIASDEVFTARKTVKVDFYIGGVELLSEDTAVSEGVLAYYQNNGTVTTTEPTSWNAKLEYNASNGFTLTLNNLQASGSTGSELNTACAIRVNSTESDEPLTIILYGTNTLNADSEDAYAGLCATTGNLTISGTGSLHVNCEGWYGIYTWGYAGNNLSIEGGEISFSGATASCNNSIDVSTYENAVVLVGDDAATATTWDGTTHLSNYKYVSVKYS